MLGGSLRVARTQVTGFQGPFQPQWMDRLFRKARLDSGCLAS